MIAEVKQMKLNEDQTIDMLVKFGHIPEDVWFTASPNDPEPHGRELYQRALNGEFGEIA